MEKIKVLRREGLSYRKIADALEISVNTVRAYCEKNGLTQRVNIKDKKGICPECGSKVLQDRKHKPRRFCSDNCRVTWWNNNQFKVNKKAFYKLTCSYCKKEFESYGNKNRKFCSHECYIKSRFGGFDE